ncbi:MAG: cadherin domain-containing protein, partial [Planctomycetota bacterium]
RFAINSSTGVVTVAGGIDREAAGSYNIIIRATSSDTSFSTQSFTIIIGDVDEFDVTPVVDSDSSLNRVNENAANGTAVGITAQAFDLDGTNNSVSYSLLDNAGGRFAIDSMTGLVTVANGSLINYELSSSHQITIQASSADGSFATASYTIQINDLDEFDVTTPTDQDSAANLVQENSAVGSLVGLTAAAVDQDGTNNLITFSLSDDDGGRFTIDSSTGVVRTAASLEREVDGAVRLITIRATSADGSFSEQTFSIAVGDQDEFDATVPADSNPAANFISENSAAGSLVGLTATSLDLDATNNLITYSLSNDDGGRFSIDPSTGTVTTTRSLDYETDGSQRQVTIRASSADGSFAEQTFTIYIGDVDEYDVITPVDSNPASNLVWENSAAGTAVGLVASASDSDGSTNQITFSLTDDDGGRFAIDSATGTVTTTRALDRESDGAARQVTIRATSADGSFSEQSFTIAIGDLDEFDATTPGDINPAANQVAENAAIGTTVGLTLASSDFDATQSQISFQLLDSAGGRFAIDTSTGIVTVAGSLDYETATTHTLTVRALSQDGSFADQIFTINILPLNDGVPVLVSPASYSVGEHSLQIGTVSGTDSDLPAQGLTYSIGGGADAAKFTLDPVTGELRFVALQNYESPADSNANGVYEVVIRVSDGELWSEQLVQVTVTNQNDQPVSVNDTWSFDEDTALDGTVATNDSDEDGDSLGFELLEGPANAASFQFNADGTFHYLPVQDYYGTDTFRYRMSDGAGGTAEAVVTL